MEQKNLNINDLISENKIKDLNEIREISLDKFIRIFKKQKRIILIIFFSVFGVINLHTIYLRIFNPIFLGEFSLLISDPLNKTSKNFNPLDPDNLDNIALGNTRNDVPTLITFLKSTFILNPVANKLNTDIDELKERLKITPNIINESSVNQDFEGILNFQYLSKSPKTDIFLLNALSKHFINSAKKFKQQRLTDGLNFLAKQEPELQEKVDEVQNKIKDFRKKHSIIQPIAEGKKLKELENLYLEKIKDLDDNFNNLENIKNEIVNGKFFITGFKQNIVTNENKSTLNITGLNLSTSYQTLLEEFNKIENELSFLRTTFKPNAKIIKSFEKRSKSIKPILKKYQLEAVEAALLFNRTNRKSLENQRKEINRKFNLKPDLIKEYDYLNGRLKVLNKNFTSLIDAKEEFQLQLAKDNVSWTIIESPNFSEFPIYPSIRMRLFSSLMIGLFTSFIVVFFLDSKKNYFKNERDIKERFSNLHFLGSLNYIKYFKEIKDNVGLSKFITQNNNSFENSDQLFERKKLKEKLRNIFTSIKSFKNEDIKIFLITSAQNQEGKSLLSILLSITISELNSKVLLIDADLRKPKINDYLKKNFLYGLSDFLISDDLEIKEYEKSVDNLKNLKYIPSGSKVNDPIKLLSSNKFQNLLYKLKSSKNYDYILINSTPTKVISDSLVLSKYVDKIIHLISIDNVSKDTVYESLRKIVSISNDYPFLIANNTNGNESLENNLENKYLYYYF